MSRVHERRPAARSFAGIGSMLAGIGLFAYALAAGGQIPALGLRVTRGDFSYLYVYMISALGGVALHWFSTTRAKTSGVKIGSYVAHAVLVWALPLLLLIFMDKPWAYRLRLVLTPLVPLLLIFAACQIWRGVRWPAWLLGRTYLLATSFFVYAGLMGVLERLTDSAFSSVRGPAPWVAALFALPLAALTIVHLAAGSQARSGPQAGMLGPADP